ncbi:recombination regulator RecX [Mycobacterium sp. M1]|uniref:Regulatory protein RecX n=1 Tax=Mycolicibacter acidiphilus TaxID=2835306 RepID=A0ABS5RCI2_9MYCO|nr:recombination regulator RecX [Mycolicibacter acidiphilus]MBS9531985.1 recombination regulator RecX [Mycolicibacter acidiphilus]
MTFCPLPSTSESVEADPAKREEQAKTVCLRLLTARARTRAELAEQLTKRGYPDDVSERVLNRLTTAGLIDDADFAEQWVRSRHEYAGKGRKVLAAELRTKGVADDVIAEALADLDSDAERDRAEQLVHAKLRRESLGEDDVKVTRRLVAMLARRGYNPSMAYEVVRDGIAGERERRQV